MAKATRKYFRENFDGVETTLEYIAQRIYCRYGLSRVIRLLFWFSRPQRKTEKSSLMLDVP